MNDDIFLNTLTYFHLRIYTMEASIVLDSQHILICLGKEFIFLPGNDIFV